ncbi:MAG: lipase family protein [Prevotella sp.]|jgi:predicted esterase|nr:lipase family protein [Prevotella sp.]
MKKRTLNLFLVLFFVFFYSCQNDEFDSVTNVDDDPLEEGVLATFDISDLEIMEQHLLNSGIELPELAEDSVPQTKGIFLNDPLVKAIKVSCKTPHPSGNGTYINASGVLLVPKRTIFTSLSTFRIIVATPGTYTANNAAPSNAFKNISLVSNGDININYFWTLQAKRGYVVLMPDYPGFGDSYGECFHPYLDSKALVESTIDLLGTARNVLSANGYRYKKELVISGYSQGGFVAAALARELETNTSHGYKVNLLFTGGTPCNLKMIADIVRASDETVHTYFLPYAVWGYKLNKYPFVDVNSIMKEPYASTSKELFDGTRGDLNEEFPHKISDLYTERFIKNLDIDPSLQYLNTILVENSVEPWKNDCKFIMTHGIDDVSVYYANAKDFADKQNAIGGKVKFWPTLGDHVLAFVPYYTKLSTELIFHK